MALLLRAEYQMKGSPLPPTLFLEELFLAMVSKKEGGAV
jgi:hypothetical protein